MKEKKPDGKEKRDTGKAQQAKSVFTDYVLPIDFEDALVVAVADAVLKPKRKWRRHDGARRK